MPKIISEIDNDVHGDADLLAAWKAVRINCRGLFDGLSSEWDSIEMSAKLRLIRHLERRDLLDRLVSNYISEYRQTNPHVLDGLGAAVGWYERIGFVLRLPSATLNR